MSEFDDIVRPITLEAANPEWHSFVSDMIAETQAVRDSASLRQLERKYDQLLRDSFPVQDEVKFSGKIRIEQYEDEIALPKSLQDIMQRYPVQSDEYGEFYEVAGESLLVDGVFVDEDGDGEVLEVTSGLFLSASDDEFLGGYTVIAYMEEIANVVFPQEDFGDSANYLQHYLPDIYQRINELLPLNGDFCEGIERMCGAQLSFFPAALSSEEVAYIETVMANRLYNEGARYTIHIGGTLYSINDDGESVRIETDQPLEHAVFSHVVLQDDGHLLKPYIVFEAPVGDESLSAVCMVDVEDIVHIEEITKNINAYLGGFALLLGDSSYIPTEDLTKTISRQLEDTALFPQDLHTYDSKNGAYLFPVPLFQQMRREFDNNPLVDVATLTDRYWWEIAEIAKPIRMVRGVFADHEGGLFGLNEGEYLEGAMSGVAVVSREDGARRLGIQLEKALIIGADGQVSSYFSHAPVYAVLEADTQLREVWRGEENT
ncbi:MAG: hypothetical protein Q4A37_03495 [Candidatus Saccharibacteria bacterium]|nr:hypothetical protein [Candidatus Saccharibacteria bacterium]